MFIDITQSPVRAEQHRRELLADAEQHRLASTVRAGRRAARRATDLALQRLVAQRTAGRPADEPSATAPPGPRVRG
jgi:hypothetical protein